MGPSGPVPPPIPAVDDNKIAELIQRAITYTIDTTEFAKDGHAAVNDFLVTSLGQAKIEMDVETADVPILHPVTGESLPALDEDGNTKIDDDGNPLPATQTVIVDQTLRLRHFAWNQFRWEPQQHWSQCQWIAFEHLLTKEEIEDEWGVTLSAPSSGSIGVFKAGGGSGVDEKKPQSDKYEKLFKVYEIWDKKKRQVVYICYQHDQALEVRDDPLKLKGFYPCPCPMMLNVRGDDLVPQPDFAKCESMFEAANVLFGRIDSLTKQVKDVGFYDGAFADLVKLTTADDGTLVPISNLLKLFNDINPGNAVAGYDAVVFKQNNKVKVETIQLLTEQLAQLEQQIWKSYGVSDIQRGSTDPNETATAQNIKAEWADIRVGQRISGVAMFFRDTFRIMADVIATFPPDVLEKMTGIALNPAEMAVLQSDVGRCYAIDIESDSTASQNEMAEQGQRLQFLDVTTKYLQTIGPAMQQGQIPADLGKELLLVLVNSFKIGRQLEDTIDNLPNSMEQLSTLNTRLQQAQQQIQGLIMANKGLTKQLQGVNMGAEDRANLKASTDAQTAAADNRKTDAETMHEQVLAAKDAQEIGHMAKSPHPAVVPFRPPGGNIG